MKKITWVLLTTMAIYALSSSASAETTTVTPEKLKGTWIVDAEATESHLKNSPLPQKDSEKFLDMSAIMFQLIYDFDGGLVTVYIYNGDKRSTYRIYQQQDNQIKYFSDEKQDASDSFLTVTTINDRNISISSSQNTITGYFLFKRVKLDPKTRMQDAKLAMDAWKVAIQNIARVFTISNPAVNSPKVP